MTRTRHAVLGMLLDAPCSGYDLKKAFDDRVRHFWAESPGQIYPALRELEGAGLVRARQADRKGRPRTVYEITRAGRKALREWLAKEPARALVRNEILLKIFFGVAAEPGVLLEHVERAEKVELGLRERYAEFEREVEELASSPDQATLWKLTLSSGQHVNRARLEWCREARRVLRKLAKAKAP